MARSGIMAFSALWRAYSEGRLERSLDLVDPDCELVALEGDRTYAGHDGVRAWLDDVRHAWKTLLISYDTVEEPYEGCVIASGRVTASAQDGRVLESPLICVAAFRDDRLVRGRAFRERDDAERWAAALHNGPTPRARASRGRERRPPPDR